MNNQLSGKAKQIPFEALGFSPHLECGKQIRIVEVSYLKKGTDLTYRVEDEI